MPRQMSLWPTQEEQAQNQDIWRTLDHQQQKQVTTILANLIKKIVYQEQPKQVRENDDER